MIKKDQEGAIIIEAIISFTTFMFVVVMILAMINICLAQAKISTLVHGIAKDVSNYSYLYSMSGAGGKEASISNDAQYAKHSIDEVIDNSDNVFDAISNIQGSNMLFDKEFWSSFVSMIKEGALNGIKGGALNIVCKNVAEKRLSKDTSDADAYLKWLGIEEGIAGLNFSQSEFCVGGKDDIIIVCNYKVHVLRFLNINHDFHFTQCGVTKAWAAPPGGSGGNSEGEGNGGNSESNGNSGETEEDNSLDHPEEVTTVEEMETTETEPPVEDDRTLAEIVRDATHNDDSDQVMLGLYNDRYDLQAEDYGMTYYSMDSDDYDRLAAEGLAWEANERFLENQHAQGKTFYMCSDPFHPEGSGFYREVEWLRMHGYTFERDAATGLWIARLS